MKVGETVCQAVSILILLCLPLAAADTGPALQIRVQSARHSIAPRIYGINLVDESLARELRLPVTRWGGNATTLYNWKNNMANRAGDWFFENLPEAVDDPSALSDKSAVNAFIDQNMRTGTSVILTVPLLGWTPKDRGRNRGFSVANNGAQQRTDDANPRAILPDADQTFDKSGFTATFPASSITLFIAPAAPADLNTSLVFPQVAAGGGYATTFMVTNTGGNPASGILNLTDQAGNPLEVTVTAAANNAAMVGTTGYSFPLSLQPGASGVLTVGRPGAGDASTGWARVDSSGGSLSGVATFQYADDRGMKSIAGVLSSQLLESAAIPLDNDGNRNRFAGFAVANPGTADIHLTVTTFREDGNVADRLQPTELNPLGPQKQVARFLHEYLASHANFRGSMILTAEPGEKFAVVALTLNQGLFTAVPVMPRSSPWKLVWSDEFDGPDNSSVDGSKWVMETGGGGWGNQELETYTSRIENAHVEGGALVITALRGTYTGTDGITRNYTSARLKTQGKLTRKYGRFEARLKLPSGQGMWPAFWMLGDDIATAGWPACGEIDIMENIGREPSIVHGTIHGPGYSGAGGIGASLTLTASRKFSDAYHVFAVEWEPGEIRWIVDGIVYQTRRPADLPAGRNWVFDKSFFIILNLAVGGTWPGNPDSTTAFPQKYLVDYVRVYERVP